MNSRLKGIGVFLNFDNQLLAIFYGHGDNINNNNNNNTDVLAIIQASHL